MGNFANTPGTHSIAWAVVKKEGITQSEAPSIQDMLKDPSVIGPGTGIVCDASFVVLVYKDTYPLVVPSNRPEMAKPMVQAQLATSILSASVRLLENNGGASPNLLARLSTICDDLAELLGRNHEG